ncbi:MAG: paraquat-inducible protein A [Deltaproteobacteria bacterium]|nr:paraquat-inducible protein A [Deltaproteobacteria bacterium]
MSRPMLTAAALGLCSCQACGLVSRPADIHETARCPRCNARVSIRKPDSIRRCWALVIAAYILYLPANLLTIMETGSLIDYRQDTIMSGVVHLWKSGSWGISAIVFIASIVVPLFKLMALTFLLVTVQLRTTWWPVQRAKLYRMVELVGRWSMLDIYVVTILAALVQMSSLATVRAGSGAIAFGSVVVLTMFAAMEFDPRLIWDPLRKESDI